MIGSGGKRQVPDYGSHYSSLSLNNNINLYAIISAG